jgi:RND family efflux transporter MFP subunit
MNMQHQTTGARPPAGRLIAHRLLALGTVLCAAGFAIACHGNGDNSAAAAASIPTARVATAQRGNMSRVLTLAGQFQPYQMVDVHPKVSGYMRKINVDIGDIVKQGQTLAILEVPELKAQLQQTVFEIAQSKDEITRAQHEIGSAEATHAALHSAYERLQEAAKGHPGLIAQQELDDARAKDLSSQAQVDSAKAAMAAAQQHMGSAQSDNQRVQALHDYTKVVAPIDGVVVWRYADTGALIQGGTNSNNSDLPIVRLSQSQLLRLRVPVPEDDVRFVHDGDTLSVRVDSINRSFTGKIVRFTRDVNFETRTMETEIDVQNRDLSISPGMYANTMLELSERQNVVTIPIEALVLTGGQNTVYALDNSNRVQIRNVNIGLEGQKLVEIAGGLERGDRVIVGGQENYRQGEEISPLLTDEPASETVHETGGTIDMKAEQEQHDAGKS